jgi:hypothetical protein
MDGDLYVKIERKRAAGVVFGCIELQLESLITAKNCNYKN